MSRDPLDYPFWLASRSAGVVAHLLLSSSVVLGLVMAARLAPVGSRPGLRVLHERVALLALGAVAAHGLLEATSVVSVGQEPIETTLVSSGRFGPTPYPAAVEVQSSAP